MTKKEIKAEIEKVLDQIPESVLEDLLQYLNSLKTKTSEKIKMSKNLKKILEEDKSLLEKLAQ